MIPCPLICLTGHMPVKAYYAEKLASVPVGNEVRPSRESGSARLREGGGEQCALFERVRLGGSGGWAGAHGALDARHGAPAGDLGEKRADERQRPHVGGLFLHPDDTIRARVPAELG